MTSSITKKDLYKKPILKILYRLLKTYNIPIYVNVIKKAFIDVECGISIDMMFLRYVRRIKENETYEEEHHELCMVVDYIWCKFIYDNYDSINKLSKDSYFMLGRKETLKNLVTNLQYKYEINNVLNSYPEFTFYFQNS